MVVIIGLLIFKAMSSQVPSQEWRLVRLHTKQGRGFTFEGSGFILVRGSRSYVLTTGHIIERAKAKFGPDVEIYISLHATGKVHSGKLLDLDPVSDLAIVGLDPKEVAIEVEAEEEISEAVVGEKVSAISFDDENTDKLTKSTGIVQMRGPYDVSKDLLITSGDYPGPTVLVYLVNGINCRPGASGSPLFDSRGRLLGYVKGHSDDGDCLVISIERPIERLNRLSKTS